MITHFFALKSLSGAASLTLYLIIPSSNNREDNACRKHFGKGENAGNKYNISFPKSFLSFQRRILSFGHWFPLLFALNWGRVKIFVDWKRDKTCIISFSRLSFKIQIIQTLFNPLPNDYILIGFKLNLMTIH